MESRFNLKKKSIVLIYSNVPYNTGDLSEYNIDNETFQFESAKKTR